MSQKGEFLFALILIDQLALTILPVLIQQRKMKTDSKLSKRIVDALGWLNLDEQETIALQAEVMGEIERIVQKDPIRSKLVLQMIRLAQQISRDS